MAGIFDMNGLPGMEGMPEHWFSYIAVYNVDERAAKALAAGGTLIRPPFDVQGVGRIAIIREPGGAAVGWMTSSEG